MNRLILGDMMSSIQTIEDGSVDLVVMDPPYLNITGGSGVGKTDGRPGGILKANDGKIFEHNAIDPEDYLPEIYRVLADRAHLYLMTNFLGLNEGILDVLKRHGFEIHNLLVWRKNNATPNRWYMKDLEYTIFARKGAAFQVNDCGVRSSITVEDHPLDFIYPLDHKNPGSPKLHPTEKPVNLMATYIRQSSKVGDTVLDPFMGCGSTAVAAQKEDRNFIGIEIDPEYFKIACRRVNFSPNVTTFDGNIYLNALIASYSNI